MTVRWEELPVWLVARDHGQTQLVMAGLGLGFVASPVNPIGGARLGPPPTYRPLEFNTVVIKRELLKLAGDLSRPPQYAESVNARRFLANPALLFGVTNPGYPIELGGLRGTAGLTAKQVEELATPKIPGISGVLDLDAAVDFRPGLDVLAENKGKAAAVLGGLTLGGILLTWALTRKGA